MKVLETEFLDPIFREESENDIKRIEKRTNNGWNIGSFWAKFFLSFDTLSIFYIFLYESFEKSKKEGDIRDQRFRLNKIMYFFMENEEGAVTLNYAQLTNTLVQKKVEL